MDYIKISMKICGSSHPVLSAPAPALALALALALAPAQAHRPSRNTRKIFCQPPKINRSTGSDLVFLSTGEVPGLLLFWHDFLKSYVNIKFVLIYILRQYNCLTNRQLHYGVL
jgi:hypothetical protein